MAFLNDSGSSLPSISGCDSEQVQWADSSMNRRVYRGVRLTIIDVIFFSIFFFIFILFFLFLLFFFFLPVEVVCRGLGRDVSIPLGTPDFCL